MQHSPDALVLEKMDAMNEGIDASVLLKVRMIAEAAGRGNFLERLPNEPTKKQIMGRLVEFIPRDAVQKDFDDLCTIAKELGFDEAFMPLRRDAYDEKSPHHLLALHALGRVDSAARAIADRKEKERRITHDQLSLHTEIRGCCGGH